MSNWRNSGKSHGSKSTDWGSQGWDYGNQKDGRTWSDGKNLHLTGEQWTSDRHNDYTGKTDDKGWQSYSGRWAHDSDDGWVHGNASSSQATHPTFGIKMLRILSNESEKPNIKLKRLSGRKEGNQKIENKPSRSFLGYATKGTLKHRRKSGPRKPTLLKFGIKDVRPRKTVIRAAKA